MTQPKKTFTITRTITQTAEIEARSVSEVKILLSYSPVAIAWQDHPEMTKVEITEKPQKG